MKTIGISRIQQVAINAQDLARAVRFYRETLGLKLLFDVPPTMAFFDCGGVRLMISLPSSPEIDRPGSILYYLVPDLDAAYRDLAAAGVEFTAKPHLVARMPDHELHMAFLKDSEGNTLALSMEKRL